MAKQAKKQPVHTCVCGKEYKTIRGLVLHQKRSCNLNPNLKVVDDLKAAKEEMLGDKLANAVLDVPRIARPFQSHPDLYTLTVSETDLLFLEDSLQWKLKELQEQIGQVTFTDDPEQTVWTPEDGMFLGMSFGRLSALLFQAQFLRHNPSHTQAL